MRSRKKDCQPKYLYNYETLMKIVNYKTIFMAFDEDESGNQLINIPYIKDFWTLKR